MLSQKTLTTTLLFSSSLLSPAMAGGATTLSIEPFVAEWCAAQFPDQLPNFDGYGMAKMFKNRDYVRIEPYLGKYCFEQFPEELKDQLEQQTLANMGSRHVQVEPYLKDWGDDSFGQVRVISIEPYVAKWCAYGQFKRLFSNPVRSLNAAEDNGHVKIETALGRWCFAQFPTNFAALTEDTTVAALASDHKVVENHLIKWEAAEYNFLIVKSKSASATEKAILGLLISVLCIAFFAGVFVCWRYKTIKEVAKFQQEVQMAENMPSTQSA